MKKIILLVPCLFFTTISTYTYQNYKSGDLILGLSLGEGSAHIDPVGEPQLAFQQTIEFIFSALNIKTGLAFGIVLNADVNFFGNVGGYDYSFAISTTLNMHVTLAKYLDWYVGIGFGVQMFPTWTRHTGPFVLGAGFDTGFNVYFNSHIGWSIGMSILAEQITGTTGIKFKFSGL